MTLQSLRLTEPHTHAWGTQPEMFGPRHEHRLAMIVAETNALPRSSRVLDAAVGLGQLASRLEAALRQPWHWPKQIDSKPLKRSTPSRVWDAT